MYQVLYRKWRPRTFSDVVGQDHITKTLQNEIKSNRINHAYLFTGSRGTGKTTCAKILANAVNCPNAIDGNPCGECEICRGAIDGSLTDIIEMDAASNRSIENIRDIIEESSFSPAKAKYRVYIIDEVHMLTKEAFNALLKVLEEPPKHVMFILATTEVHKLLPTIISRCQRFDFHRISAEAMGKRIEYIAKEEGVSITKDAYMLIASVSDGALRDALSLMDRCMGISKDITEDIVREAAGLAQKDYLFSLSNSCINKNVEKALKVIDTLHNNSKDMALLTSELIDHFRSLMLIKTMRKPRDLIALSDAEFDEAVAQSNYCSLSDIVYYMDVLQRGYERMGKGTNNRVELETALVRLSSTELDGSNDAMVSRITALERAVNRLSANQSNAPATPISVSVATEKTAPSTPIMADNEINNANENTPTEKAEQISTTQIKVETPREPAPPVPNGGSQIAETPQTTEKGSEDINEKTQRIIENAVPFPQWPDIVQKLKETTMTIGNAFVNTTAYISGNYILIDSDIDMPFILLKQPDKKEAVRNALVEITGKKYSLGPYKKPKKEISKEDHLGAFVQTVSMAGINTTVDGVSLSAEDKQGE